MKKIIVKILILMLSVALTVPFFAVPVSASNYASDYRLWSQGCSDSSDMVRWGCWVVAQAKLIYEAGVDRSSSFDPDNYMQWQQKKGLLDGSFNQMDGDDAPVTYAAIKGKKLNYLGLTAEDTKSCSEKVWSNINNGYFSIIRVYNPNSGNYHYIMVDNASSLENGTIYCYNSFTANTYAPISSLASRRYYNISRVYTYSAPVADNLEAAYEEMDASVTGVSLKNNPADNNSTLANNVVYASDAHLTCRIMKNINSKITQHGCILWKDGSTQKHSITQTPMSNYQGKSSAYAYFNVNDDMNLTLEKNTKYWYQIFVTIDGLEYTSEATSFITCPESNVKNIVVQTAMKKLTYELGDPVSTDGLVLGVSYTDGKKGTVTDGFTISQPTLQTTGTELLTVSYQNATTQVEIAVNDPTADQGEEVVCQADAPSYLDREASVEYTALTSTKTGISVTCNSMAVSNQTALISQLVSRKDKIYSAVSGIIKSINKKFQLYNVSLQDEHAELQLQEVATVTIPVPKDFTKFAVYRLDGDEKVPLQFSVTDGYINASTDQLGVFAIVSLEKETYVGWLICGIAMLLLVLGVVTVEFVEKKTGRNLLLAAYTAAKEKDWKNEFSAFGVTLKQKTALALQKGKDIWQKLKKKDE